MEAVVAQAAVGEPLEVGRLARPAEGAAVAEAHVVEQDDEHVGGALGGPNWLDRWEAGVRVLRVVGGEADVRPVGDRQDLSLRFVLMVGHLLLLHLALSPSAVRKGICPFAIADNPQA